MTTRPLDCKECKETWELYEQEPPCGKCFPGVHPYNEAVMELYQACGDQYIVGPGGVVALNDLAVISAMKNYFKVRKKDRLGLSKGVRKLSAMIVDLQMKKAKEDGKNSNRG